jgi:hypothetical protein
MDEPTSAGWGSQWLCRNAASTADALPQSTVAPGPDRSSLVAAENVHLPPILLRVSADAAEIERLKRTAGENASNPEQWDFDAAFEFGLRLVLDGVETAIRRSK